MSAVSIVVPTYNRADLLERAIDSALSQRIEPLEVIVVDDGSTDETPKILDRYNANNLHYFRSEVNRNANVARNVGIKNARSEYILFLDSDDELYPDAAATLARSLDAHSEECAGVFPSYSLASESGETSRRPTADGKVTFEDIFEENVIGGFTGNLVRRSVIESIGYLDESLEKGQDVDFYFRVLKNYYMWGINDELYRQYYHGNQISTDESNRIEGETQILDKHGDHMSSTHRAKRHDWRGMAYAYSDEMTEARSDFVKAIRLDPFRWEYYYHFILSLLGGRVFVKGTPRYR